MGKLALYFQGHAEKLDCVLPWFNLNGQQNKTQICFWGEYGIGFLLPQ